jgi:phosphate transport system protein
MRNQFDDQLKLLNNSLIEMGGMTEHAIEMSNRALVAQDEALAREVIVFGKEIDDKEKEIESLCLKLLLQQQPVARDLRQISSALKMITDMERIGDHSEDISEMTLLLAGKPYITEIDLIPRMSQAAIKMLHDAVDSFVRKDLKLAQQVIEYDDIVDGLFDQVKAELIGMIRAHGDAGEQAIDLMMVAKYFERIGDHAVNIAEWVVFSITGLHTLIDAELDKQ